MECKLENITIHYEMYGEGKPMLLLHGRPLDHRCISGCMEPIFRNRKGWLRIYPDLPGMGKTQGVDWITTEDQVLEVVLNFIDKVIPGQNFALAGLSYGGYLARGVIHHRPKAVDGLLLIVPSITYDRTKRSIPAKVTLLEDPALIEQLDPSEAEGFEYVAVIQNQRVWERHRDDILAGYQLCDEKFLAQFRDDSAFSFDVDKLAEPFDKATLILAGRQDHFVGYRNQWDILENHPRATFVVLDRAGHMLYIEQEDLFNALVNEWLDRVEESLRRNP